MNLATARTLFAKITRFQGEISGSQGNENKDVSLRFYVVLSGRSSQMLPRCLLPPSSLIDLLLKVVNTSKTSLNFQ